MNNITLLCERWPLHVYPPILKSKGAQVYGIQGEWAQQSQHDWVGFRGWSKGTCCIQSITLNTRINATYVNRGLNLEDVLSSAARVKEGSTLYTYIFSILCFYVKKKCSLNFSTFSWKILQFKHLHYNHLQLMRCSPCTHSVKTVARLGCWFPANTITTSPPPLHHTQLGSTELNSQSNVHHLFKFPINEGGWSSLDHWLHVSRRRKEHERHETTEVKNLPA